MCDQPSVPAQVYARDTNRVGQDMPVHRPEWVVYCIARVILFILQRLLAMGPGHSPPPRSWWEDRPDLPAGSAQALASSIRGQFGNAIAWMCRRNGIGPGHAEWPELSRAIVAFGGSLDGFRAGALPCELQWWENPAIVPGMVPFKAPRVSLLSTLADLDALPPTPALNAQAETAHALWPASWRQDVARAGTGPPSTTGPPEAWIAEPVITDQRGRSTACPAVLIRTERGDDRAAPTLTAWQ